MNLYQRMNKKAFKKIKLILYRFRSFIFDKTITQCLIFLTIIVIKDFIMMQSCIVTFAWR